MEIRRRQAQVAPSGWPEQVHPVLQRVYAARGIAGPGDIDHRLARMLGFDSLGGIDRAVALLAKAIVEGQGIVVAGDYDCDGATGTAVAVRGLRMLGARQVGYVIPNRFLHGYGLTPALVASMPTAPDVLLTVDNGVASIDGVAAARARGSVVIVTDHHLPGPSLPAADAMVNPNLDGDGFPSKALAGVGVVFYLLLALRAHLREAGHAAARDADLSTLLDLVALGTVADLVPLDFNNRVLVDAGLRRMRQGRACPGIVALVEASGRSMEALSAVDLGFAIAPRLNAAGRLEDMRLGVEALLTDDAAQARGWAMQLDTINRERRQLQADMVADAEAMVARTQVSGDAAGVALFDPSWHAGVVGLVASKLKERLHRPVLAFAPAGDATDELRGSGRSIAGFHLRDALALIDARHPGLILRFGGHAMAAGLSLRLADFPVLAQAFDRIAREQLDESALAARVHTDGGLEPGDLCIELALQLRQGGPWGQAFAPPCFDDVFVCLGHRVMAGRHWRLDLVDPRDGRRHQGVMFNVDASHVPARELRLVYELDINHWQGRDSLQLLVQHMLPA
ncbi:single-stranded-DNA-specific exonuclease RecJ [Pinirhizobacter soli]|uniref:single-stranded-DNA-specific exonuclease RecJ n=1 Tax=Pinirhizobacter soli TaxID=2786953 RepID=UPI00202A9E11